MAEEIPRRKSRSMDGKSAKSSTRITNCPVIRPGVRFVSANTAAVASAAASFAFGLAGGAVVSAGKCASPGGTIGILIPSAAASVRANAAGTVGRVALTVSAAGPGVTARASGASSNSSGIRPGQPTASANSADAPSRFRPDSTAETKAPTRAFLRSSRRSRVSASTTWPVSRSSASSADSATTAARNFVSEARYSVWSVPASARTSSVSFSSSSTEIAFNRSRISLNRSSSFCLAVMGTLQRDAGKRFE